MTDNSPDQGETSRFNAEQRLITAQAPEKWRELKREVVAECERIQQFATIKLEVEETEWRVRVSRIENGLTIKALTVTYDPSVPRIVWECKNPVRPGNGSIFFRVHNGSVFYIVDNAIELLPYMLPTLTSCITG